MENIGRRQNSQKMAAVTVFVNDHFAAQPLSGHQEKPWLLPVQEKMMLRSGVEGGCSLSLHTAERGFLRRVISNPVMRWPSQAELHPLQAQKP